MDMSEKIQALRKERGLTLEAVGDAVGVGKSTVRKWECGDIKNMRRDKIAKLAEALGVTPGYLMGWDDKPNDTQMIPVTGIAQIPIVGSLRCGRGGIAMQVLEGTRMAANVKHPDEYVYFHATGDSMEPLISEGDYALIHKQDTIESGEIAAVCVGATDDFFIEGMIKKVKLEPTRLTLISLNSKYDPMIFDREEMNNVKIVGKVIRIEKDL